MNRSFSLDNTNDYQTEHHLFKLKPVPVDDNDINLDDLELK